MPRPAPRVAPATTVTHPRSEPPFETASITSSSWLSHPYALHCHSTPVSGGIVSSGTFRTYRRVQSEPHPFDIPPHSHSIVLCHANTMNYKRNSVHRRPNAVSPRRQNFPLLSLKGNLADQQNSRFRGQSRSIGRFFGESCDSGFASFGEKDRQRWGQSSARIHSYSPR